MGVLIFGLAISMKFKLAIIGLVIIIKDHDILLGHILVIALIRLHHYQNHSSQRNFFF